MNRLGIWAAAGAVLLLGAGVAWGQDRGPRDGTRDGWRGGDRTQRGDWGRGDRTQRGDWSRGDRQWRGDGHRDGWRGDGYSGRHWSGRYSYPRYGWRDWGPRYYWSSPYYWSTPYYWGAYPSWLYPAPYVEWEPPVHVERYIEREPVYVERAYEQPVEPRPRTERYAQRSPEPAKPVPRLERYTLSATELFEFDKATLRMPQPKLDEIAQAMRRNPGIDNVTITGYTDRIGADAYNLKLSKRRAEAVKAYLIGKGVESRRLVAIGKGKASPVVQCNDQDRAALIRCLEPNRRVEVEQIAVEVRR
jgi:outer membrane protein OmpA-like peptidoglycan-associated protein